MHLWQTNPFEAISITGGQGCTVWDAAGKPYLDLLSGVWCNVLGHGHPRWVSAVQEQAARLTHVGAQFVTAETEYALAKLAEILPPELNRAVFLNTGSEAVELGLKMALAATSGHGVVVMERGYYGATTRALSLSEAGRHLDYLPPCGEVHRLPLPDCRRCPAGCSWPCDSRRPCLDPLVELTESGDIAAVLFEPVLGGGIFIPPRGYVARLRELATRVGALLIAEEVTTGLGRTGRWFGFQHEDIVPDILILGKAIGGGLPISAVVTTAAVEERCRGALGVHVQSHQNDPFSGRIAATVISILQEEHLVERAAEMGRYLMAGLGALQAGGPWIREVRGRGAMVGVELQPQWSDRGVAMSRRLLEAGFIVNYHPSTATFRLFPPYTISTGEIDAFVQAFSRVLEESDGHGQLL